MSLSLHRRAEFSDFNGNGFNLCSPAMHLPINIDDVLHGQTVEWGRLEFKPDKPNSRLHRYQTTTAGKQWLSNGPS